MTNCFTDLRGQVEHLEHEHYRTEGTRVFQAQCATWLTNWRGTRFTPEAATLDYCEGFYFRAVVDAPVEDVRLELSVDMESCRPILTVLCDGWSVLGAEADGCQTELPLDPATGLAEPLSVDYIDHLRGFIHDRHIAAHLTLAGQPA